MIVYELDPAETETLRQLLNGAHRVRVGMDGLDDGVKVSADRGVWSYPALGTAQK